MFCRPYRFSRFGDNLNPDTAQTAAAVVKVIAIEHTVRGSISSGSVATIAMAFVQGTPGLTWQNCYGQWSGGGLGPTDARLEWMFRTWPLLKQENAPEILGRAAERLVCRRLQFVHTMLRRFMKWNDTWVNSTPPKVATLLGVTRASGGSLAKATAITTISIWEGILWKEPFFVSLFKGTPSLWF